MAAREFRGRFKQRLQRNHLIAAAPQKGQVAAEEDRGDIVTRNVGSRGRRPEFVIEQDRDRSRVHTFRFCLASRGSLRKEKRPPEKAGASSRTLETRQVSQRERPVRAQEEPRW